MSGTPSVIMYPSIRWRNLGIASFIDPFCIVQVQIYIIDFIFHIGLNSTSLINYGGGQVKPAHILKIF